MSKNTITEKEAQELLQEYEHITRAIELVSEYFDEKIKEQDKQYEEIRDRFQELPSGVKSYRLRRKRSEMLQWFSDRLLDVFNKLYEDY